MDTAKKIELLVSEMQSIKLNGICFVALPGRNNPRKKEFSFILRQHEEMKQLTSGGASCGAAKSKVEITAIIDIKTGKVQWNYDSSEMKKFAEHTEFDHHYKTSLHKKINDTINSINS